MVKRITTAGFLVACFLTLVLMTLNVRSPGSPTAIETQPNPPTKTPNPLVTHSTTAELTQTVFLPVIANSPPSDCSSVSFGTLLLQSAPDDNITPASVLIYAHNKLGVRGKVA